MVTDSYLHTLVLTRETSVNPTVAHTPQRLTPVHDEFVPHSLVWADRPDHQLRKIQTVVGRGYSTITGIGGPMHLRAEAHTDVTQTVTTNISCGGLPVHCDPSSPRYIYGSTHADILLILVYHEEATSCPSCSILNPHSRHVVYKFRYINVSRLF
ncbi:hypothetical protein O6H91_05G129400 [Diphasiastrum complanatum]|uniref:Uncharacterized protein n=1 Tax=Diphasiastrum complanatum TaxID=34168 RepID=A0ACC2DTD2_DIPCM|nr:hypothetical protein O6H91_05G129400 [Diphasiastrum complanatum]